MLSLQDEISSGLETAYKLENQDIRANGKPAYLLLAVKEAVLDVLGINKKECNRNKNITNEEYINSLPEKIQKVIKSTDINEILGVLEEKEQKRVLKLFNNNPESRFLNLIFLNYLNKSNKKHLEASLESDKNKGLKGNWRANINLGNIYYVEGTEIDKAITYYFDALKTIPKKEIWRAYTNLGNAYYSLLEENQAIDFLKKALLSGAPKNEESEIYYALGLSYNDSGNYKEAIICFNTALKKIPNNVIEWEIYYNMGKSYHNSGDYNDAINYYNEALKTIPEDEKWKVYGNLGKSYILNGNYDKAIESSLTALTSNIPKDLEWDIYSDLGIMYYNFIGDYKNGYFYLSKALNDIHTPEEMKIYIKGLFFND